MQQEEDPRAAGRSRDPDDAAHRRLMERVADGDDAAYAELYRALAPRLLRFLQRLTGRADVAEDLTQETFLRLHRARGAYDGGPLVPWLFAIARNVAIDHGRSARVRRTAQSTSEDGLLEQQPAGANLNAESAAIARQAAEVVERELALMTPARREAFVLLRYEGMSVAEVAQIVDATESAVKLRAFHAYEQLRRALGLAR